jgi:hypothetical protein
MPEAREPERGRHCEERDQHEQRRGRSSRHAAQVSARI